MKKTISILLLFAMAIGITVSSYAAEEYTFELQYTGKIEKNVTKEANVLLIGKSATMYSKVRIKIDVSGPSTPKIIAKDSLGNEYDIAQIGYWGPPQGFAVGGDFTNTTPVKATFAEAGTYTITLSLINLENSTVITQKSFPIEVAEDNVTNNNTSINNVVVEELPKTGVSVFEYIIIFSILLITLSLIGIYAKKRKYEN